MAEAWGAPPAELLSLLTAEQAWHYRAVPHAVRGDRLELRADSVDEALRMELEVVLGRPVTLLPAEAHELDRAIGQHYRRTASVHKRIDLRAQSADDVLNDLAHEARSLGSSDIHIESYQDAARVRIRIDGHLVERYRYAQADHLALVNRVKVQAGLDISEKRLPQDGRMALQRNGARSDIRVSVLPTLHGEKAVLRLLGQDAGDLSMASLGMDSRQLADYQEGIRKPHGLVLISGPTGSGKTTTLYATLKELNQSHRNIITIEDPIEYTLDGINQVQLKEAIGLSFAQALRSFLRQDPDVIMVGEIRDAETAQMAVRAALTGHLVLSTIHTNSAWGTVSRLLDMGVPPYLLAGTLNTSVAQRLLRLLCPHCKRIEDWDPALFAHLPIEEPPSQHAVAVGCAHCHFTGYKGRRAVHEVVALDAEWRSALRQGITDASDLLDRKDITVLSQSALHLIATTATSVEEAYPLLTAS